MKTDALIAVLATEAAPVDVRRAQHAFDARLAAGAVLVLLAAVLVFGVRRDLAHAASLPMFWVKLLAPAAVAMAAWVALRRLGHPGMQVGRTPPMAMVAPVALLWILGAGVLLSATPGDRLALLLGRSSAACALGIALLSVPAFWLALQACRQLAPTRLRIAGATAGLFAGAVAASAYGLHCDEMAAPFVALWYVLGLAIPALAGAFLGRRLLHW